MGLTSKYSNSISDPKFRSRNETLKKNKDKLSIKQQYRCRQTNIRTRQKIIHFEKTTYIIYILKYKMRKKINISNF